MYSAQDWQGQYAPCASRRRFVLGTGILESSRGFINQQRVVSKRRAQMRSWITALQHQRLLAQTKVFRVSNWLSSETVWTPQPTERHAEVLGNLLALPSVQGNLVPDTHLAALAIGHDLTLCSTDGDLTPAFRESERAKHRPRIRGLRVPDDDDHGFRRNVINRSSAS